MSTHSQQPARESPENPELGHLEDQAEDLLKAGQAESLAGAQVRIARQYGFASWAELEARVELLRLAGQLKLAIDANDLDEVKRLMTRHPELHRAPLGYGKNGPLTWVAECRVPRVPPSETRLAMARWMHGLHDVTPIGYAARYPDRHCVNTPALAAIIERGGKQ